MKHFIVASAALALPVLIIGCERETETSAPTATPAGQTVPPATPSVGDRTRDAVGGMADQAQEAAGGLQGTLNTQLEQVSTYIRENKLDLAEQALAKIEQNKSSLPESLQPRVTQLREQLNKAKQSQGGTATPAPTTPAP